MTVLQNTVVNPDDVAAHWLDWVAELASCEKLDVEIDYEEDGGRIRLGDREVHVRGAWSEVVFQWYSLSTVNLEGDYRIPLTFDRDEKVTESKTVQDLLDEAVDWLDGWKADIVWDYFEDELWAAVGVREEIDVEGEGLCCRDASGMTWGWTVDLERGNAGIAAGLYNPETGKVDWMEYGFVEGLDVLLIGMAKAVEEAVAEVRERLAK